MFSQPSGPPLRLKSHLEVRQLGYRAGFYPPKGYPLEESAFLGYDGTLEPMSFSSDRSSGLMHRKGSSVLLALLTLRVLYIRDFLHEAINPFVPHAEVKMVIMSRAASLLADLFRQAPLQEKVELAAYFLASALLVGE